ncbi:MAG TPA: hypothetical protein PLV61_07040 [Parvularculaceae bacterium]|nr:hypothetical protein [Parvularculaceae bacterium]
MAASILRRTGFGQIHDPPPSFSALIIEQARVTTAVAPNEATIAS